MAFLKRFKKQIMFLGAVASIGGIALFFLMPPQGSKHSQKMSIDSLKDSTVLQIGEGNTGNVTVTPRMPKPNPAPKVLRNGGVGKTVYDEHISVLLLNEFRGPILASEKYNLVLELGNKSSQPLHVMKIVVRSYNEKVKELFEFKSDLTFTSEHHVPVYLEPHEKKTVSIVGNEILPNRIEVDVYHNQSDLVSRFTFDAVGYVLAAPRPRKLGKQALYIGFDGYDAILMAKTDALKWSNTLYLVAAIPGNTKVYMDPDAGLKYIEIESWIVTFCSPEAKQYVVIVDQDYVNGREIEVAQKSLVMAPLPVLGNQRVTDLANQAGLLVSDWKNGPRLLGGKVGGKWTCAWYLPYIGPDSNPLIIDAQTGHRLHISSSEGEIPIYKRLESLLN